MTSPARPSRLPRAAAAVTAALLLAAPAARAAAQAPALLTVTPAHVRGILSALADDSM